MRSVEQTALAFHRACESAGVNYVLVGGIAVAAWGQPRATSDVDALVEQPSDAESFARFLAGEQLSVDTRDLLDARTGDHISVFDENSHFHVDIKIARTAEEIAEVANAASIPLAGGFLRVARAEETVAFKLLFGTPQDLRDAQSILDRQGGRLDLTRLGELARRLRVEDKLQILLNADE